MMIKISEEISHYLLKAEVRQNTERKEVAKPIVNNWLADLVSDCTQDDIKIISDTVTSLKQSLKKNKTTD